MCCIYSTQDDPARLKCGKLFLVFSISCPASTLIRALQSYVAIYASLVTKEDWLIYINKYQLLLLQKYFVIPSDHYVLFVVYLVFSLFYFLNYRNLKSR